MHAVSTTPSLKRKAIILQITVITRHNGFDNQAIAEISFIKAVFVFLQKSIHFGLVVTWGWIPNGIVNYLYLFDFIQK